MSSCSQPDEQTTPITPFSLKKRKIIFRFTGTGPSWPGLTFVTTVMRFYVDGCSLKKSNSKGNNLAPAISKK